MGGTNKKVWYILTDVDDQGVAAELGLNYSAKLTYAAGGARTANFDKNNNLIFDKGTVDLSPVRKIVPGPSGAEFSPVSAQPGSVGDKDYSPLVRVLNDVGTIYNAPIVARECFQKRDDLVFLFIRQAEHTRRSVKSG